MFEVHEVLIWYHSLCSVNLNVVQTNGLQEKLLRLSSIFKFLPCFFIHVRNFPNGNAASEFHKSFQALRLLTQRDAYHVLHQCSVHVRMDVQLVIRHVFHFLEPCYHINFNHLILEKVIQGTHHYLVKHVATSVLSMRLLNKWKTLQLSSMNCIALNTIAHNKFVYSSGTVYGSTFLWTNHITLWNAGPIDLAIQVIFNFWSNSYNQQYYNWSG